MIERNKNLSTEQKALTINLDEDKYGTIVEIGAGQEVARQFFNAGAAAGTIAKTASAYDMQVSDEIYGKVGRYVSQERVIQMLDHEYDLLIERLAHRRSRNTLFFCYAATVTAKGYNTTSENHGWVGLRVQLYPGAPPSQIIMHVRMLDDTNQLQSDALGILGVNLIYSAYHHANRPNWVIESLRDNLDGERIEVDLINFSGPYFEDVDHRLINLHLVRSWCCRAVMFNIDGKPVVPGEELRKKDTLVLRGSFHPPTKVHVDMMECALRQFSEEDGIDPNNVSKLAEITMADIANHKDQGDSIFLAKVEMLTALGYQVLISDYLRFFRLRSWIRRYTQNHIGIVLSVLDFKPLFDPRFYEGLEGGLLEAMGKLFSDNTYVYVYPAQIEDALVTIDNAEVDDSSRFLLTHLIANRAMVGVNNHVDSNLHISPAATLKLIEASNPEWQNQVPTKVADIIKCQGLFGYK